MKDEQDRTTEVLQLAVRTEIDGKQFYLKASRKSSNKLGKDLFQQLAAEEDVHRRKFEQIYTALGRGQSWLDVEPPSEKGKRLRSLFSEATKALGSKVKAGESELEAIRVALDMEKKSYDLYHSRSEESTLPVEKRFYEALAGEERGHHLALTDSLEYLSNPAGFFTKSERWSLDGI